MRLSGDFVTTLAADHPDCSGQASKVYRQATIPHACRPAHDGGEIVNGVADRVRAEMFRRIGLEHLLSPRVIERPPSTPPK
jgi:hypothetical protein